MSGGTLYCGWRSCGLPECPVCHPRPNLTLAQLEAISADFGGWLDGRLAARSWSYRKAGALAGVNASTVLRLRRGERQPTLATAVRLIGALGR